MWVPQTLLQSKGFVGCRQSHLTLHRWNFSCCRYLPEQLKDQAHRLVGDETPPELEAEGSYFLKRISKGWWFMMILQTCASYVRCYIYIYMQLRSWRASWSNTIFNHISAPLLRRPSRDLYSSLAIFNYKPLEAGHAAVWWPELLLGQHGEPRFAGVARDVCHLCVRKTVC